jgi:Nitrogenase component 1 type Oxidoreductase
MTGGRLAASQSESDLRKLKGSRLRCGYGTRERFARLLGLSALRVTRDAGPPRTTGLPSEGAGTTGLPPEDAGPSRDTGPAGMAGSLYSVEAVHWVEDHVEIRVVGAGLDDGLDVTLDATRAERPTFLSGPEVSLWFRRPEIPPSLALRFRQVAGRNLARLRLRDLARAVLLDPDNRVASVVDETDPVPEGISIPTAAEHAWTHPAFYADFFAAPEIRRAGCDIIDVHTAHTLVSHGDVECSYCAVCVPRPRTALLRLPVYETVRNIGRLPDGQGLFNESEDLSDIISSDMTEQDVILGAPGRIEQVLEHAERHRKKDRLLMIGLCLPDVIGEDQDAAVEAYAAKTETPVFMVPASPRSWAWFARDMLQTRRKTAASIAKCDSHAINLIGFADNEGTRELGVRLASVGVRLNTRVLPELHMDAVDLIPQGALNVYLPNIHWEKAYSHLEDDELRGHLTIDGPYGIAGTRAWLQRVCAALGMTDDGPGSIAEEFDGWMNPIADRWNRLRAEAGAYRLGVVVSDDDIGTLLDARFTWGIALLSVLHEMGFGLDLFVGGPRADAAVERFRTRTSLDRGDYVIDTFDSFPSLLEALAGSPCRAVFSNYVFDWRLVQAGKTPFSTLELEMGLQGAVLTLERLLAACRLPLFCDGRRFLRNTAPAGYDDER